MSFNLMKKEIMIGIIVLAIVIIAVVAYSLMMYKPVIPNQNITKNEQNQTGIIQNNTEDVNPGIVNETNQTAGGGKTYSININNFKFDPATLPINVGDTVIWTNFDSTIHSVKSNSGLELNSGTIQKEKSYAHTFNKSGTYFYQCSFHQMMQAKIIVN